MDKKYALDREREDIERNVSLARDALTGRPYSLDDPGLELDPAHGTLHKIEDPTDDQTEFNFINERPIVAGLNLAHRPRHHKSHQPSDRVAALDPMTDIKRRERFLQKERVAREAELQREYS